MRVRRTFCNVTMLGQMLPKTLSTHQVSESGDVVTAFLMFQSDVPLMVDQHCPFSWSAIEFESKSFSSLFCKQKIRHLEGFVFSIRWQCKFQMATLWKVSPADGQRPDSRAGGGWLVET